MDINQNQEDFMEFQQQFPSYLELKSSCPSSAGLSSSASSSSGSSSSSSGISEELSSTFSLQSVDNFQKTRCLYAIGVRFHSFVEILSKTTKISFQIIEEGEYFGIIQFQKSGISVQVIKQINESYRLGMKFFASKHTGKNKRSGSLQLTAMALALVEESRKQSQREDIIEGNMLQESRQKIEEEDIFYELSNLLIDNPTWNLPQLSTHIRNSYQGAKRVKAILMLSNPQRVAQFNCIMRSVGEPFLSTDLLEVQLGDQQVFQKHEKQTSMIQEEKQATQQVMINYTNPSCAQYQDYVKEISTINTENKTNRAEQTKQRGEISPRPKVAELDHYDRQNKARQTKQIENKQLFQNQLQDRGSSRTSRSTTPIKTDFQLLTQCE